MPGLEEPTRDLGSNHRQANQLHIRCCCMTEVLQSSIAVAWCDVASHTLLLLPPSSRVSMGGAI